MREIRSLATSLALAACLAGVSALSAQEAPPAPAETTVSGPKITIHGFLSQAYTKSDGHQILGISDQGSADYRSAALQLRADISPSDIFIVQLSHERLGKSPVMSIKNDVELDWIFYEHRFGGSAVKVGRVQIPFGIYNEVLDVGTVLPLYRPPRNFYGETAYSAETVDGILLTHTVDLGRGWGLQGDVYFGDLQFPERNFTGKYVLSHAHDTRGAEVWLDTPLSGVRVGAGATGYEINSVISPGSWKAKHLSVSAERERFDVHSEYKWVEIGTSQVELAYAQAGFHFTDKLKLNVQEELGYIDTPGQPRSRFDNDRAVGLNYAFNPGLVVKAEHHWTTGGFWLEDIADPFAASAVKTRFWILSLATSF